LTQEELAEAARLSPRSVSDLERGINKTARKDTALLLADALNLAQPVREVFVQAARGRTAAADVLDALSALRNNLPAPVDSFVGRQVELTEIHEAVRAHRLVTLAGPGGSGKTRLALEAAASLLPAFGDGVWLVALAAVSDGSRLPETVAQVLQVSDRPGEAVADTLERWLRDRETHSFTPL
jgi:transcriptional regulator with XRE-family HTH domain